MPKTSEEALDALRACVEALTLHRDGLDKARAEGLRTRSTVPYMQWENTVRSLRDVALAKAETVLAQSEGGS